MFVSILLRLARLRIRWLNRRHNFIGWRIERITTRLTNRRARVVNRYNRTVEWVKRMEEQIV